MIYVILRFGIIVEYQLQVGDVFSICLQTRCPVGTKPSLEIQRLRTRDDNGPERPIETRRFFVTEISAGTTGQGRVGLI